MLGLALLLSLVSGVSAGAQTLDALAASLAASSPVVVTGRVSAMQARWDQAAGAIYTYVTVEVTETLKGQLDTPRVVVKQLGGQVGDIGLRIGDQATYTVGEDVLVFLAVRPRDGTLYPAGFRLGKWRLVPNLATGERRAVPETDVPAGLSGAASSGVPGLDMPAIRDIVGASPAPAQTFVTEPAETGLASPAFSYLPTGGRWARWHQVDDNRPIPLLTQTPTGNQASLLGAAMNLWNTASTRLRLQSAGTSTPPPGCSVFNPAGDRQIWLFYNDPCGEISDADPNAFGIGGGYFTSGDVRRINGIDFDAFVQGIAIVNNAFANRGANGCFQDALTHVLGHAIGLGDSTAGGAIMRDTLAGSCTSHASGLGQDDINGIRSIYPAVASGPAPPQPPTTFAGTTAGSTVHLAWTPSGSGGPAATYIIEAGTGPGLTNITTLTVNAPATAVNVGDVPNGVYYARVRARNIMGTSAPSPEAVIIVGPCAVPGTPTGIDYLVNNNQVMLSWQPSPAGGPVANYRLVVGTAPGLSNALNAVYPASVTALSTVANYGDYWVRLGAANVCGASPWTPEFLVPVRQCTAPPGVPTGLSFTKSGQQVSFTWTRPAGANFATAYVLVVGSAPGAADLLVYPTGSSLPRLTAVGPPGHYFVRVYAANACGWNGGYSNEVQVDIP